MANAGVAAAGGAIGGAAAVETLAGQAAEHLDLLPFEPEALRPSPEAEAALRCARSGCSSASCCRSAPW